MLRSRVLKHRTSSGQFRADNMREAHRRSKCWCAWSPRPQSSALVLGGFSVGPGVEKCRGLQLVRHKSSWSTNDTVDGKSLRPVAAGSLDNMPGGSPGRIGTQEQRKFPMSAMPTNEVKGKPAAPRRYLSGDRRPRSKERDRCHLAVSNSRNAPLK